MDGSTDGTTEFLATWTGPFPLRVVWQPNSGAAAARNRGAEVACGSLLLFLDDDMLVDPEILVEQEAAFRHGADAAVGDIAIHEDSPANLLRVGVERWAQARRDRLEATGGQITPDDFLTGQLAVRATAFRELGGFDVDFTAGGTFGGEDVDFLYRCQRRGFTIVYVPAARSSQLYVVTPEGNLRQWREAGRAAVRLSHKHAALRQREVARHGGEQVARLLTVIVPTVLLPVARFGGGRVVDRARAGRADVLTRWAFVALRRVYFWEGVAQSGGFAGDVQALRVLAYHAVDHLPDHPLAPYSVEPELFAAQLEVLEQAGFEVISMEAFLRHVHGQPVLRPSVLITFDDGYRSLLEHAQPIMAERGLPATVFAVTAHLGGVNAWDAEEGVSSLALLSGEELTRLSEQGWHVGSHTRTHQHLHGWSLSQVTEDFRRARADLEALGLAATTLAYPYGEHNALARLAARRAGYAAAFGLAAGPTRPSRRNRFALPRIEVGQHTTTEELLRELRRPTVQVKAQARRELGAAARTGLRLVARVAARVAKGGDAVDRHRRQGGQEG